MAELALELSISLRKFFSTELLVQLQSSATRLYMLSIVALRSSEYIEPF